MPNWGGTVEHLNTEFTSRANVLTSINKVKLCLWLAPAPLGFASKLDAVVNFEGDDLEKTLVSLFLTGNMIYVY